jgi:tryptophan halogenase
LGGFVHQLGIEEQLLFSTCQAVPIMGQRFSNWSGDPHSFLHGYDNPSPAEAGLGFRQLWIKGRQSGLRTEWESFSAGAMMAKAGRVPAPRKGIEPGASYGYNVDACSYSALMRQRAIRYGVECRTGDVSHLELEGDRLEAIILNDGERIEGDLFVDASGASALLIGSMPGADWESWREWLPCDRMLVGSAKSLQPCPGFSDVLAVPQGWVGLFPLQDRTAVVAVYDSHEVSDEDMLDNLPSYSERSISGDAVVSAIEQGIRRSSWVGNCVAVGESAFSLEPLDAIQLHVAHYCISQLMTLFPVEAESFPEAELYNRIIRQAGINLRDFQSAHYKLNRRLGEPLWDRSRQSQVPQSLQRKFDVFAARGRVPLYDDETFQEEGWESLFLGHGLTPESYDPRVDALSEQQQIATVHDRLTGIGETVAAMSPVDDFLNIALPDPAEVSRDG